MRSTDVAAAGNRAQGLRVMIAGGGTGGHVIPALAIARELRDRYGAEVRFVGTARGLETRLVPEAGFPLELIKVGQLKNVSIMTRIRTMLDLPLGVLHCVKLLQAFRPQVVVGVGGYASGPAMMAALLLRTPTLAFEPNAVPGLANRLVGRRVSAAAVNLPETASYFRNATVTGTPVRPEFFAVGPGAEACRRGEEAAGLWCEPGSADLQRDGAEDHGSPADAGSGA
ncbi:MAG: UDP-N-acetylglucosamine--N-acetylmuramyl-(pentapeptide) pyrophosphoryl-undecaprenol N-acetylglucosamine transferase [Edaphobacter sp.]|uniref:UDP-N-acetylglucosamine--N-acetylmuramyl- (pentapeptide) pyrophosphoryl-undecaprenol N-acetylglucosamine transferase n=1 Tax=Edaphobacter sp. TaxID=1934404 RepID=UPI00238CE113|nr:UDP-N-acetylglucosamine--N-acetylmuramyl-(pentapeptide) pyrophosphoryl-undecaprenol N-acetylglucosamine transferase [Edaphobacter sp.]MDE1177695.1 UDP-N-acetylglucosamine--N-acetylmuramyl-(pentapeptide) pyrophosphoryl-undecaprenol N-acetylglucosamine transferase [Edaphobacter sp.]